MPVIEVSPKTLKQDISIRAVMAYYQHTINEHDKTCCPFHEDANPSMWVNREFAYCFACGRSWDIFDFVRSKQGVTFAEAVTWLSDNKTTLVELTPDIPARQKNGYLGPVSPELVQYWQSMLTDEHRHALECERGLTGHFVTQAGIGWRPDWQAFSIPFWRGEPGQSEIDIVQFRTTPNSPDFLTQKYIGLAGHNHPSLIGRHTLRSDWALMVFGTFDALLAAQYGFPCISPNGATTFATIRAGSQLAALTPRRWYVLFDKTESERASAEKTAAHLPGTVTRCELPAGDWKDFSDYMLCHSLADFYQEVLQWSLQ